MEIPIKFKPVYPWMDMAVGDHFTPPADMHKNSIATRTKEANYKLKPRRFAAKTTKGRWEIRRIA